jgi:predicted glycosyltransferase
MLIWIDIEGPPHVQYLVPFKAAFEKLGHEVVVTARPNSITLELLA